MTPIVDIRIAFNPVSLQDITDSSTLQFTNYSTLYFEDATPPRIVQASDTNLQWSWFLVDTTSKTLITNSLHLQVAQFANVLLSGYRQIRLECLDTTTGKKWGTNSVVRCVFNMSNPPIPPAPQLLPNMSASLAETLASQLVDGYGYIMSYGGSIHVPGSHYIGGKVGDLNGDGAVNSSDLLMFLSNFGS